MIGINNTNKKEKDQGGFTLIEIVAATALFAMLVLSATQIFNAALNSQRTSNASQSIQENMRYFFETVNKEIRSAKRADTGCDSFVQLIPGQGSLTAVNKVYNINSAANLIFFKNKNDQCSAYYLSNGRIVIRRGSSALFNETYVTPASLSINRLFFNVSDNLIAQSSIKQPRLTISIRAQMQVNNKNFQAMDMETTISSRFYE